MEMIAFWLILILSIATDRSSGLECCDTEFNHTEQTIKMADDNLRFTMALYKEISNNAAPERNLLFSPICIIEILSMVYAGAEVSTEEEFQKVLHFDKNKTNVNLAFKHIQESFQKEARCNSENFTLISASRMYVAKEYRVKSEYQRILEKYYLSEAVCAPFASDPVKARADINKWIKEITKDKIDQLIPTMALTTSTALLLINAVYFKGNWSKMFEYELTREGIFKQRVPINTNFMHATANFPFAESERLECKVLEFPYLGGRFSFFAILPKTAGGLAKLESAMTREDLSSLIKSVKSQLVIVYLPKFKIEIESDIGNILEIMGITRVFTRSAELSGISKSDNLEVSKVLHKASLEVNEEGSEVAADTAFDFFQASDNDQRSIEIAEFIANHPFMFLVYDKAADLVIFMGRLSMPTM